VFGSANSNVCEL